jgi:hypothetical protein
MLQLIITLITLSFLILCYQGYRYSITLTGTEKQDVCQHHGIFFTSLGTGAFLAPSVPVVFAGVILIMLGLRLIAHSLDRLDKTVYIDHYTEEELAAPCHGEEIKEKGVAHE